MHSITADPPIDTNAGSQSHLHPFIKSIRCMISFSENDYSSFFSSHSAHGSVINSNTTEDGFATQP